MLKRDSTGIQTISTAREYYISSHILSKIMISLETSIKFTDSSTKILNTSKTPFTQNTILSSTVSISTILDTINTSLKIEKSSTHPFQKEFQHDSTGTLNTVSTTTVSSSFTNLIKSTNNPSISDFSTKESLITLQIDETSTGISETIKTKTTSTTVGEAAITSFLGELSTHSSKILREYSSSTIATTIISAITGSDFPLSTVSIIKTPTSTPTISKSHSTSTTQVSITNTANGLINNNPTTTSATNSFSPITISIESINKTIPIILTKTSTIHISTESVIPTSEIISSQILSTSNIWEKTSHLTLMSVSSTSTPTTISDFSTKESLITLQIDETSTGISETIKTKTTSTTAGEAAINSFPGELSTHSSKILSEYSSSTIATTIISALNKSDFPLSTVSIKKTQGMLSDPAENIDVLTSSASEEFQKMTDPTITTILPNSLPIETTSSVSNRKTRTTTTIDETSFIVSSSFAPSSFPTSITSPNQYTDTFTTTISTTRTSNIISTLTSTINEGTLDSTPTISKSHQTSTTQVIITNTSNGLINNNPTTTPSTNSFSPITISIDSINKTIPIILTKTSTIHISTESVIPTSEIISSQILSTSTFWEKTSHGTLMSVSSTSTPTTISKKSTTIQTIVFSQLFNYSSKDTKISTEGITTSKTVYKSSTSKPTTILTEKLTPSMLSSWSSWYTVVCTMTRIRKISSNFSTKFEKTVYKIENLHNCDMLYIDHQEFVSDRHINVGASSLNKQIVTSADIIETKKNLKQDKLSIVLVCSIIFTFLFLFYILPISLDSFKLYKFFFSKTVVAKRIKVKGKRVKFPVKY